jgi:8-oxo-dGTP diphosphatase
MDMFCVALVLVQQDRRTLLIQEAKELYLGRWNLPGGRLEPGESLADAAVREAREESGLEVRLRGLLCMDQLIADGSGIPDRLRFVFAGEAVGGALKTTADEHSLQARWVTRDELAALDLRTPMIERVIALSETASALLPLSSILPCSAGDRRLELR